jgi:alpha-L-fucosidase
MHDLNIPVEEYEKLASKFSGKEFNADSIIKLAKDTGMKYFVFTSKHHDGFAMYDSKVDEYNVVQKTPYAKDIVQEFRDACDKYDIKFGLYYSQAQDWHNEDACEDGIEGSSKNFDKYFREKCLPQLKELLTNYGKVDLIWFDTPMYMNFDQSKELETFVYNLQPDCMISGRIGNSLGDYMTTGDNFIPLLPYGRAFEVPATLNETWGFNKHDFDWKSPEKILKNLVKIISRGGNYLLNIGPDEQGLIPSNCLNTLDLIGKFMEANGDSIYETVPTALYPYDIDWGYFTSKKGKLFIHVFERKDYIYILNIQSKPLKAFILGDKTPLKVIERKTCEGDSSWRINLPKYSKDIIDLVICVDIDDDYVEFEEIRR